MNEYFTNVTPLPAPEPYLKPYKPQTHFPTFIINLLAATPLSGEGEPPVRRSV
jgi:hypothetical protein